MLGLVRMPRTDMAERVDDALISQNAIGGDQFFKNEIEPAHSLSFPCSLVAAARRGTQRRICAMPCAYAILGIFDVAAPSHRPVVRRSAAAACSRRGERCRVSRPSDSGDRVGP